MRKLIFSFTAIAAFLLTANFTSAAATTSVALSPIRSNAYVIKNNGSDSITIEFITVSNSKEGDIQMCLQDNPRAIMNHIRGRLGYAMRYQGHLLPGASKNIELFFSEKTESLVVTIIYKDKYGIFRSITCVGCSNE